MSAIRLEEEEVEEKFPEHWKLTNLKTSNMFGTFESKATFDKRPCTSIIFLTKTCCGLTDSRFRNTENFPVSWPEWFEPFVFTELWALNDRRGKLQFLRFMKLFHWNWKKVNWNLTDSVDVSSHLESLKKQLRIVASWLICQPLWLTRCEWVIISALYGAL